MNNHQVCDVKKHAMPEGSPLPLFFRCITELLQAPY